MTKCRQKDCLRAPAYPDQAYCREHQLRWAPAVIERPVKFVPRWLANLTAKEMRDAA